MDDWMDDTAGVMVKTVIYFALPRKVCRSVCTMKSFPIYLAVFPHSQPWSGSGQFHDANTDVDIFEPMPLKYQTGFSALMLIHNLSSKFTKTKVFLGP